MRDGESQSFLRPRSYAVVYEEKQVNEKRICPVGLLWHVIDKRREMCRGGNIR